MPDYWDKNVTCDAAAAGTVTRVTMARGSGDRKLDNTRPAPAAALGTSYLAGPRVWGISKLIYEKLAVFDMNAETV